MWIVAIAWMYVAVMMTVAEATATNGSILGACITFILYGVLPLTLVMYILGTPARRKARQATQQLNEASASSPQSNAASAQPDASGLPARDAIASEREIP